MGKSNYLQEQLQYEKNITSGLKSQVKILKVDHKNRIEKKDREIDDLKNDNQRLRSVVDRASLASKIIELETQMSAMKSRHGKQMKDKQSADELKIQGLTMEVTTLQSRERRLLFQIKKHNVKLEEQEEKEVLEKV